MDETEVKNKLEQVFSSLVMTQEQRNTLNDIILQASKTSIAGNAIGALTPLEEEAEITEVITAVNQIINAFK